MTGQNNTKQLKGVFFDMDGVLYDSMKNHAESWEQAMKLHDVKYPKYNSYLNEGRTGRATINWAFNKAKNRNATQHEIDSIYAAKTKLMQNLPVAPMIPHMKELITQLIHSNIQVMVVTGSNQKSLIDRICKDYQINRDLIITGADVKNGKPHPEPYLKALTKSQLSHNEVIIIENAPLGIQSAVAANIFTIAINTGILDNKTLAEAGANGIINNSNELIENWSQLVQKFETSNYKL